MITDTPHLTPEQATAHALGGLSPGERAAADAHTTACPACAAAVAAAGAADADLRRRLPGRVPAGLEDRVVGRLRSARRPSPPAFRRAAVAAAAAAAVIGTGRVGSDYLAPAGRSTRTPSDVRWAKLALASAPPPQSFYYSAGAVQQSGAAAAFGHQHPVDALTGVPRTAAPAAGPYDGTDSVLMPTAELGLAFKPPVAPPAFEPNRFALDGSVAEKDAQPALESRSHRSDAAIRAIDVGRESEGRHADKAPGVKDFFRGAAEEMDPTVQQPRTPAGAANEPPPPEADGGGEQPRSDPPPAAVSGPPATRPSVDGRKVIRTGTMAFNVDRFDTAAATLAQVAAEAGGYVATTDSAKGANGKTAGTITVRCPPERLDGLVLALRSLGDLKSQQITAEDVTKVYTDDASELVADRAMADRLLELIRTGKGSIKDLLAAETELGTWRAKIEKLEGELRYLDAQVGLSTLAVSLSERDLRQAATAVETGTADLGVEADDVEHARDLALAAIDAAHGRTVEAELKHLDAGQLAATIVADVPAEASGATIDRLRQLGRVVRLEVHRQQTAADPAGAAPVRTERRPTRLTVAIYNLANVAPRRTVAVTLAADDPESAYAAVLALAGPGGRVVTSNLDRAAGAATGTVALEFPPARLEAAVAAVRSLGAVLKRTTTEAADTQATTDAKVGLTVTLESLAGVTPRESVQQTVAAADVPAAYRAVLSAAAGAHVRTATLNEQDRQNVTADLSLDVPRSALAAFDRALASAGDTTARTAVRSDDAEHTADVAVRVQLSLVPADRLPPRETTTLTVEAADVDRAAADAQAAAVAAGGRVLSATVDRSPAGPATAEVVVDVPLARAAEVVSGLRQLGAVRGVDAARDPTAPAGPLGHAHVQLNLATADALVADAAGPSASVRRGLSLGLAGLLWSLQLIVVGLCLLVPWAAAGYVLLRAWRRWGSRRRTTGAGV